eukprot:6592210-Pyramimonas_sp.AAC.1
MLVLGVAPNDRMTISDPPRQAYSYVLRPAGGGQITRGYLGVSTASDLPAWYLSPAGPSRRT